MERMLSVTIEGQRSPGRVDPGWVREVIERYRRDGVEPRIEVKATHGASSVHFTIPPPRAGSSPELDPWEAEMVSIWREHRLFDTPFELDDLCVFLARAQSLV